MYCICEIFDYHNYWSDFFQGEKFILFLICFEMARGPFIRSMSSIVSIADDPLTKPRRVVDVGCGIGGSSRYLAKRYGARCQGITLSSVQAQRAQALTAAEGLEDKVK